MAAIDWAMLDCSDYESLPTDNEIRSNTFLDFRPGECLVLVIAGQWQRDKSKCKEDPWSQGFLNNCATKSCYGASNT